MPKLINDEWSGMGNRIKQARDAKGWSMRQLGEAAGTSAQQINKLEKGQVRLTVDWLRRLARALGVDPSGLMVDEPEDLAQKDIETSARMTKLESIFRGSPVEGSDRTLPILGRGIRGKIGVFEMPVQQTPVAWTFRPRQLEGVSEAYGVLVFDDTMAPKYEQGQTAWVHPHLGPSAGRGVVVIKKNDEAEIRVFVRQDASAVTLRQLRPPREYEIPVSELRDVHVIIGAVDPVL